MRSKLTLLLAVLVFGYSLVTLLSIPTASLTAAQTATQQAPHAIHQSLHTFHEKEVKSISPSQRRDARYRYHPPNPRALQETPLDECGRAPAFGAFFQQNMTRRSSRGEDRAIYRRFFLNTKGDTHNFTYVELGGFNGMEESNTRFFDACLGWDGVLIEANPATFPQLVENRPHAHRYSYAASCPADHNEPIVFATTPYSNAPQLGTPAGNDWRRKHPRATAVRVPCGSLNAALEKLGGRVTFLSLDVEGAEADVVRHIDFEAVFIDIIMAENFNQYCLEDCESREVTQQILQEQGYLLYEYEIDKSDLYVHKDSPFARKIEHPSTIPRKVRDGWRENVEVVKKRRAETAAKEAAGRRNVAVRRVVAKV